MTPLAGIIMGSKSDWETMRHAAETLAQFGVPHETKIVSAHRTPQWMLEYAESAERLAPMFRGLADIPPYLELVYANRDADVYKVEPTLFPVPAIRP